jgi:hypothetical protein
MIRIFEAFLDKMKAAFRRIAGATRHEMTVGDLHGDAWLVAHEIGERRGREIDFANPEDQELVLGAVHVRNVKRGDWKMRRAVRIDQEPENEDAVIKWSERLPARASSDPLVSLLARESSLKTEELLAASYSQAAAYVMVFVRFKNDRSAVCAYLVLSDGTLARRVTSAAASVRVQPSLFDYVERIHDEFMPQPGRQYALRAEQEPESTQRAWNF